MKVPTLINTRTQTPSGERPFERVSGMAAAQSGAAFGNSLVQAASAIGSMGGFLTEQARNARRFGTLQSFTEFQTQVDLRLADMKRNANPALGNFADIATAEYNNWQQEWLNSVPDEFYDEFATRAKDIQARVARDALAFQYERTDAFFRQGVIDQVNQSLLVLDQDGSIESLEQQRANIDEFINSTTLTEAEKVSLRRQAYIKIESASYKSEVRRGNIELGALGVGSAPGQAVDLIMEFDGPALENGLDYETNRELLTRRVEEAEAGVVAALGSMEVWAMLPERARAALISLHDDLGELPASVLEAINTGDLISVAGAIEALGGDRRAQEAAILLGTDDMPEGMLDADPRYANIPYEDRLALRADAEREVAARQAAEQKAAAAQQEAAFNELLVGIHDGTMGQWHLDQAREAGWLTDYDDIKKAQALIDTVDENLRQVQTMEAYLAAGQTINPDSSDDRNMFNAWVGEDGLAAIRQQDSAYVATVLIPAVRKAGDIPTEALGVLEGMTRSQDPMAALFAFDALNQMEQASPNAYQARVSESLAADVEYWRTAKEYYPADMVLSGIRGGTTQEERTRTAMLRQEARKLVNDGTVSTVTATESFISSLPSRLGDNPQWRMGDPIMTAGQQNMLEADFARLFEQEYARDGNEALAQERALKALGRVWGSTEIGGQQLLMRYPPELAGYETWNGSHDWITEQGRAELGLQPNQSFQLISDEQTRSEIQAWQSGSGPRPSYIAVYTDENGQLRQAVDENGMPQRLFFEISEEMQAEQLKHFEQERQAIERDAFMRTYNQAMQHSLRTGTAIPEELQQQYQYWINTMSPKQNSMFVFMGNPGYGAR